MTWTRNISPALLLVLGFAAIGGTASACGEPAWRMGRTEVSITQVCSKDPAGELERKTTYMEAERLGLLGEADGEEVRFPMYCVIKFTRIGRFRVKVTCRADGNNQIIAFSPRSRSFASRDFRGVGESRTLTLEFDSSHSRYLVLNCTRGNLYVDALTIEEEDGRQGAGGGLGTAADGLAGAPQR